jgi:serine/threonine-protein kinase
MWDNRPVVRVVGGKVRLEEKIASGGMSDVYRGKNLATGASVAVKILEPCAHQDEDAVERFRTEARVSAVLQHRSIVRVFDLFEEEDGSLALVMELLVGMTLEQRIARDGPLDPDLAVAIAVPILGALAHAHAAGVIHRDVKPANVFLAVDPDGHVTPKLLDFGVAKSESSNIRTMDGQVLGTSRYMSPEQALGNKLDGRSDLFSMATVLYETMTGESPFAARDATTALAKVIDAPVDAHDRIPARVWLVLQKALAKQTYARHKDAAAFGAALARSTGKTDEELAALLHEEPPPPPSIDTPSVVTLSKPPRSRAPKRRLWPIAIAFVAGAAIVATFALTRPKQELPAAAVPPPPPPPTPTQTLTQTPTPTPTQTLTSMPTPTHPHTAPRASHAKPIATTPGF